MPKPTLALKATVTRRPASDLVDQAECQQQAEHHQAAKNAATTEQEVPTAAPEPAPVPKAKHDPHALQSAFLTGNLGKPVTVFTINGLQLTGKLKQFDQFTLLVQGADGLNSLLFKHAITTIIPASDVPGKRRQSEQAGA